MIFLLLLLSSLHHRRGIMTKRYYFFFPVSARGMADKDWPCLRQNILFAFQSKIVVIQENNQRHLCYGKWFIERETSDVMWNVPTPPWCPVPCDIVHAKQIKTAAGSEKTQPQQHLCYHVPASPCGIYYSLASSVCLFLNL